MRGKTHKHRLQRCPHAWTLMLNCNTLADESTSFFRLSAFPAQQWTFSPHVALLKVQIGCYPFSPHPSIVAYLALHYCHSNIHAVGSSYEWIYARQPKKPSCSCNIWESYHCPPFSKGTKSPHTRDSLTWPTRVLKKWLYVLLMQNASLSEKPHCLKTVIRSEVKVTVHFTLPHTS